MYEPGGGAAQGLAQSQCYKAVLGSIHLELPRLAKSNQTFFNFSLLFELSMDLLLLPAQIHYLLRLN